MRPCIRHFLRFMVHMSAFWRKAVVVQAKVRYERGAEVKMAHSDRDVLTKDVSQPGTAI